MKITPAKTAQVPRRIPENKTDIAASVSIIAEAANAVDPYAAPRDAVRQGLRFSFIVYDPLNHLERELAEAGFTHIKKLNMRLTGTQGICCVKDGTAYISFRGSASPLDWLFDFLFIPFYWPVCHFGFGSAWWSVRGQVLAWLKGAAADIQGIVLCGHSLGGGVAHLAALDLAKSNKITSVVTFGAPKACFLGTATQYNNTKIHQRNDEDTLGAVTFSVVNQRDIVSKVPFKFLGFRDVGQLIYIDQNSAVHYGAEALDARFKDSMTDTDFLFSSMEEEKISALGPNSNSTQKFYYNMRVTVAWIAKIFPPLKSIILPCLMYILFSMYFMRSGLAHLGDKYMNVLTEPLAQSWQYDSYEKTKAERITALIVRLVIGGLLATGFLWGLITIATWSVESIMKQQ